MSGILFSCPGKFANLASNFKRAVCALEDKIFKFNSNLKGKLLFHDLKKRVNVSHAVDVLGVPDRVFFLLDIGDDAGKYDVALYYAYSHASAADYAIFKKIIF